MGQQYSHLSSEERILIEKLHCEQHLSIRRTAERIGRDKSTVSRELRRGLWFASNENGSYRPYRPKRLKTGPWTSGPFYSALAAQRKADRRRRGSRKPRRMDSDRLRAWVLDALRRGVEPGTDRGTVEGPVRRRPVDADQPRVPLPVDLRQAAAGAGPAPVSGARQETPDEEKGQEGERAAHPDARAHRGPARGGRIQEGVRPFRVGHGGRRRAVEALREHAGGAQEPQAVRPARRRQERVRHGQGRIRDLQGHPAGRARRPHVGQRHGGEPAHAGGRGAGHAHVLRRPVQLLAARQQREQERQDPPLSAQRNRVRGLGPGGPRRDRRGDQRHPHETPRIQNAQRGMGRGDRQATIEGSQPEHKRCAYKLNPGFSGECSCAE